MQRWKGWSLYCVMSCVLQKHIFKDLSYSHTKRGIGGQSPTNPPFGMIPTTSIQCCKLIRICSCNLQASQTILYNRFHTKRKIDRALSANPSFAMTTAKILQDVFAAYGSYINVSLTTLYCWYEIKFVITDHAISLTAQPRSGYLLIFESVML